MDAASFITPKKEASHHLGRVLVLGLGKTAHAVVTYLSTQQKRVESITVKGSETTLEADRFASSFHLSIPFKVEGNCPCVQGSFDLCIASPGISCRDLLYSSAQQVSTELIGEVEFAWRESSASSTWIAITGTNGKTTVTALVARILQDAGLKATAVGNIGTPCLEAVLAHTTDIYVAEVSSYQLASTVHFAPKIAVLLGITPDHLRWHGSFKDYCEAKYKVLENLSHVAGSVAILDDTNEVVHRQARYLRSLTASERGFDLISLGLIPHHILQTSCEGMQTVGETLPEIANVDQYAYLDTTNELHLMRKGLDKVVLSSDALRMCGRHNWLNALAASAVALQLGVTLDQIAHSLRQFKPLEHRIEACGFVQGVACYNDSKATNVDATIQALSAFPGKRLIVLLGGEDKGTNLDTLVAASFAHASAVVCFGAARQRFSEAFRAAITDTSATVALYGAPTLEQAFDTALQIAQPHDVVLLSPACASFDEFSCFEQRGEAFKRLVEQRSRTRGES